MRAAFFLCLVGCGGADEDVEGAWNAVDFLPPVDIELEFVPPEPELDAEPLLLRAAVDLWELREGFTWDDGTPREPLAVSVVGGALTIDGALTLPAALAVGAFDGGEILALGERETWYGTFPRAVTVALSAGRLAGEAAFAEGVGPVSLTVDGESWDLAGYTP